ncbi:MAG: hypothetical protein GF350_10825 [Chitinivibrionales bacterium]|nr:hypothetical protein [Chitinivibrionales bacterium]
MRGFLPFIIVCMLAQCGRGRESDVFLPCGPAAMAYAPNALQTPLMPLYSGGAENPFSRAIGERIAGWVLLGTSALNFALAVPIGSMYDDIDGSGDFWRTLIFIEGGIRAALGATFLGIGYGKYSQWKKWERQNTRLQPRYNTRLAFTILL